MKEILEELNNNNSVLLEIEKLYDFLDFVKKGKGLYAFRLEYPNERFVKINMAGKETKIS